ncbi:MAG: hypothetical protein LQ338_006390 [Usnochroma carphineum]|nr:MAG: hypothetical protein LQ338_006390 [Usnochroma carphineum]
MSPRSNDYPFMQQTFVQHHTRHHHHTSPDRTLSDTSVMEGAKTQVTPPTPYLGEDELTSSGKPLANHEASIGSTSGISDSPAKADNANDSPTVKQHNTSTDTAKDEHPAADSSDDEKPVIKGEDRDVKIDPICAGEADGPCTLGSGDHRKVVSHVFGRNKRCTHQIPEECWIKYCRKHYQRQKYRCPSDWFETQLLLVDAQITKMEAWGGITSWTIAIRKKEREMLDAENAYLAQHNSLPSGPHCRERFLMPYLGSNKTFQDIRDLIDVINLECDNTRNKTLPSFELLPEIDERRNPRAKRCLGAAAAARRAGRVGPYAAPSSFRLSTDSEGQVVRTEAPAGATIELPDSGTPSRASSANARRRKSQLPKTGNDEPRSLKRSASDSDSDADEKGPERARKRKASTAANKEAPRPVERQASVSVSVSDDDKEEPDAGYARRLKLAGSIFDDANDKPNEKEKPHDRPVKSHRRSYSH